MSDWHEEKARQKLALIDGRKCDKYDFLIAVVCGAIAGLVDIFLVGSPGDSILGNWSDVQVDHAVEAFARRTGWTGEGISDAIHHLETQFPVNYDQRYSTDVNDQFTMGTRNHHLKSLAHSSDPIGLFFSILDQFQSKASFVADGRLIRIDTATFELRGETFHAKLFCGFCNWIGHIMSDIAGSSGTRGNGSGRGSGIALPFYEVLQFSNTGEVQTENGRASFAEVMVKVFQNGYDARFGIAMAIPVVLTDLFIRCAWAIKQHFYHNRPWKECVPSNKHADLRCMLIVGNCTLCLFDGMDAAIRSGGNPILFFMRLNIIAWFKLVLMIFKEILIRFDFTYADLAIQLRCVNQALDEYLTKLRNIDYPAYELELNEVHAINEVLADASADTAQIYQYFSANGVALQFHSFEEFDQKMQDEGFTLEI